MTQKVQFSDLFEDREIHRTILKAGLWFLLMMELVIFLWAAFHSGIKSTVAVYDADNNKIYQTAGAVMTTYERRVFERSYGPLSDYRVKVESKSVPFPFRAWLAVAVGAPIGVVLLLNYLVKAYLTFLSGDESEKQKEAASETGGIGDHTMQPWFALRRLSIFSLGMLVVVCLALVWMVPDFMAQVAKGALAFILQFKWFFLGVSVFIGSLVVWIIYLRYKIQGKMMQHQADLEKFRVEKQMLLEYNNHQLSLPESMPASIEDKRNGGNGRTRAGNGEDPADPSVIDADESEPQEADDTVQPDDPREESAPEGARHLSIGAEAENWADRLLKRNHR